MNLFKQKKIGLVLLTSLCYVYTYAQQIYEEDIFIGSSYILEGDSEADIKTLDFKAKLYEKPLKNRKGIMSLGVVYNYSNIEYSINTPFIEDNSLNDFHNIGFNFNYFRILNKKWSIALILTPQLSSNFTSELTFEDLNPNGAALLNYSSKPTNRLSFGLAFAPNIGISFPFPIINYWRKINETMEINLGFPETSLSYMPSQKTTLKTLVKFDGFNYNISDDFNIDGKNAERINYNAIIAGLGVKYNLSNALSFSLDAGYSLDRTFEITDKKADETFELDMENNLYFSFGVGINLNKGKQNTP
ncbi:DUF6268 family outer membrane beta-barrel protein [Aquimarina sp. AU119]|uniref:DUF6268 family outer membrane beta-barrel protein n=1 Tax=Aquimarina sp. AU119 TaxID=2108528 RepID=UPI000D69ACCB|nr:DUF6268 family outer membrane beta-barrel protein [Aquimarina sp. AU119]